ncbi:hypothetical protein K402DRAFT_96740 [Aulographum hederae CBS 113979]|uniref:Uncharacterized protein n=1 Tax=Aulographum hederae CBS 113979 TaxID=1176131 RepID=A0A6G1GYY3_9PEZI|nr:hypothetical protein K402DRAFT_96740 [Aulographum hederae CBS 113979]
MIRRSPSRRRRSANRVRCCVHAARLPVTGAGVKEGTTTTGGGGVLYFSFLAETIGPDLLPTLPTTTLTCLLTLLSVMVQSHTPNPPSLLISKNFGRGNPGAESCRSEASRVPGILSSSELPLPYHTPHP